MQGIIYTSPRWNKLSISRKQHLEKSPHSSLQNQIHFTAVMVRKWGLSQSSSTSYPKLAGHQSSLGQVPHCIGTGDRGLPRQHGQTHQHRAIQQDSPSQGASTGRELRGKASTAPAYGCSLASWTFGQRRSGANLIPTLGLQCWGCPEGEGQHCPTCSKASDLAEDGHDLGAPLCFVSAWPSLTWQTRAERKPLLGN